MSNYRTPKQIELDMKRLEVASASAISIKELETSTGLSYSMIRTTFLKYPDKADRIKNQLAINKKMLNNVTELDIASKAKIDVESKQTLILDNDEIQMPKGFVVDSSVVGADNFKDILSSISMSRAKIILTSATIMQLKKMKRLVIDTANNSRFILDFVVKNPDKCKTVIVNSFSITVDDCVIKYCTDNRDSIVLLTCSRKMASDAHRYSIPVKLLKKSYNCTVCTTKFKSVPSVQFRKFNDKLLFSSFQTSLMSVRVFSNNLEYNDGVIELNIGDNLLVATKKSRYIAFAHYKIISLSGENNCELVYSNRFYNYDDIDAPLDEYKRFIIDFKCRLNL